MVQKASTPWSVRTVAEGGTDSPVGDLVPIPDMVQPVINAGFIDESGKWRLVAAANDNKFTFQDPNQALAAGANQGIDINMLNHDKLIFGILDSSGNDINVLMVWRLPATAFGPYLDFVSGSQPGIDGSLTWLVNEYPGAVSGAGSLEAIFNDTSSDLDATWQFFKIIGLGGTNGTINVHSNEGSQAGTISTAYLRLV